MIGRRPVPEDGEGMAERDEVARDGMAGDVEDVFGEDELGLATWSDEESAATGNDQGAAAGGSGPDAVPGGDDGPGAAGG